ncbi:S8 family serine peptidase [Portibacter marinus]|uniref:S8 family serine peptidase n=1 Tax=Portibacter marinus TaxID=2898660 RepID=UPI001F38240C|nr:S8 family serine peptidase [Portibacter marinus]
MKRYGIVIMILSFSLWTVAQNEKWSDSQIKLINLDCLHERGFTGKGVTIAHLDDGCDGCNLIEVFKYSRDNNYWKGAYDFVRDTILDYDDLGSHGTATISIVHGWLEGSYTGAAYDANVLVARTENVRSETHQEEKDWKEAVDWSIENGADIITSSLQYNEFDQGEGDYTYEDMDGQTTIITRAADYAASKGLLVVTLQGNFGNDDWYYLTAPGDADSVITVGAARKDGEKARFSGYGPSFDGRMKPDILAMGERTAVATPDNSIVRGNGTSYAAPAIAGLLACLKQAHPERTNMQLISAVRRSGNAYRTPSAEEGIGYGVADACKADDLLIDMDRFFEYPNQWNTGNALKYRLKNKKLQVKTRSKSLKIEKFLLKDIFEKEIKSLKPNDSLDISSLDSGDYLLDVYLNNLSIQTIYFKVD